MEQKQPQPPAAQEGPATVTPRGDLAKRASWLILCLHTPTWEKGQNNSTSRARTSQINPGERGKPLSSQPPTQQAGGHPIRPSRNQPQLQGHDPQGRTSPHKDARPRGRHHPPDGSCCQLLFLLKLEVRPAFPPP